MMGAALLSLLLTGLQSCVQSEVVQTWEQAQTDVRLNERMPVAFGSYLGQQAITRSAVTTVDDLKPSVIAPSTAAQKRGFGVFGYHSENSDYVASGVSATPINYMYNEQIWWDDGDDTQASTASGSWKYSPLKYWPNDYHASLDVDTQTPAAQGSKDDRLSFFAYAPYKEVTTANLGTGSTGQSDGIIQMSANTESGDPVITYRLSLSNTDEIQLNTNADDLLWGVAASGDFTYPVADGTSKTVNAGKPLKNLVKPEVATPMTFDFHHALAGISLSVQGVFDEVANGIDPTNLIDTFTFIKVESVTVTLNDIHTEGTWNLNTNYPATYDKWNFTSGVGDYKLVLDNTNIADSLYADNTAITPTTLSNGRKAGGVGRKLWTNTDTDRITYPQPLIKDGAFFMLLPMASGQSMTVNVKYWVYTLDNNLADGWSKISNDITKTFTTSAAVDCGQIMNLNLRLGMTSASFDATLNTDWASNTFAFPLPLNN